MSENSTECGFILDTGDQETGTDFVCDLPRGHAGEHHFYDAMARRFGTAQ